MTTREQRLTEAVRLCDCFYGVLEGLYIEHEETYAAGCDIMAVVKLLRGFFVERLEEGPRRRPGSWTCYSAGVLSEKFRIAAAAFDDAINAHCPESTWTWWNISSAVRQIDDDLHEVVNVLLDEACVDREKANALDFWKRVGRID